MSQQKHHVVTVTEVTAEAESGTVITTIELQKRVFFDADANELIERVNKQPRKRATKKAAKSS